MRTRLLVPLSILFFCTACESTLPEKVALVPGANSVEVVSDPPNPETYEPVGEVSAQVIGREVGESLRQAANELRNQGAKKGATFVSIDEVTSRAAWDFSGRVVVTISGTAYKTK
jgi:hypothetical protein